MEFELDPGTYQVEIRKANHEPFAQTIEVVAGGEVTVAANVVENSTALAWTGVGLVGGGLVLGGVGALAASGARQKFDEAQSLEAQRDPELFDKLRTEGENGKLAAQVLYGGAVLLGGTGVTMIVLWWLGLESEDVPLENSATIQIGPTSVSVGMRW